MDIHINTKNTIIPMYEDVLDDVLDHKHTHYVFSGGRGSTKSSFLSCLVPLLLIKYSNIHACVFRKVANTIKTSVFAQMEWGIAQLGLSEYFKVTQTPMSITYIPTGQKIMFFGLDDAGKVKSIKLPFGYIGITWFEELDQFAGENELRKVTQSTMRGGDKFWDFRSFNPPISNLNWANEYAEKAEQFDDTLIVRNTYLDVPKDWLGEQFFDEAEQLKQCNPRAYAHEYLGQAVGTGGNVFENVEHMDMGVMVEVGDGYKPLYTTFSNIYNGLDWGFAKDPTQFVRMHLDAKKHDLYIFDEYRTYGTRNIEIFDALYKGKDKHIGMNELLTADSAEQKSIADFKAYGAFIRAAEKGPDSVRYGIKWLQSLNHIYIDKRRCPETFKEFVRYEYERDRDDNIISQYPDKDNHSIDATRYALERFYKRKGN